MPIRSVPLPGSDTPYIALMNVEIFAVLVADVVVLIVSSILKVFAERPPVGEDGDEEELLDFVHETMVSAVKARKENSRNFFIDPFLSLVNGQK